MQSATESCNLLQSHAICYRVVQSATESGNLLQSQAICYRVFCRGFLYFLLNKSDKWLTEEIIVGGMGRDYQVLTPGGPGRDYQALAPLGGPGRDYRALTPGWAG